MSHTCRQWFLTTAVVAAVAAGGVAVAGAASRPASTAASIQLAAPTGGAAPQNYTPSLGTSVKFLTTVPSGAKNPSVEVDCYQNGVLVWGTIASTTSTS